MFLLTHGLVRGGWGGRAPLRVEQALKKRGVRDRVGVRTGIVSLDTINDDGAGDNEGQELYPRIYPGVRVGIYHESGAHSHSWRIGPLKYSL